MAVFVWADGMIHPVPHRQINSLYYFYVLVVSRKKKVEALLCIWYILTHILGLNAPHVRLETGMVTTHWPNFMSTWKMA